MQGVPSNKILKMSELREALKVHDCQVQPRESEVHRLLLKVLCPRRRGHFNTGRSIKVHA